MRLRRRKRRLALLEYPDENGKVQGVEVWGISVLGDLKELGEKLSRRYRWQPAQAVLFVLTGEIPAGKRRVPLGRCLPPCGREMDVSVWRW
jgi:hypothetical protein